MSPLPLMPKPGEIHVEKVATERTQVRTDGTDGLVTTASEYRLPGVDWGYYRQMTHILRYTYEHPDGFAAHFAWGDEGEWRVLNLWRDELSRERFFAEPAADRLARGIQLLGAVTTKSGVTDVAPVTFSVEQLIFGPCSRTFANIGEDLDGRAINSLGGEPVCLEVEIEAMTAGERGALIRELGYGRAIPVQLISHHVMFADGGMRMFQTWTGCEAAEAALETDFRPAVDRLNSLCGRDFEFVSRHRPLRRISFHPEIVTAFGF